jgi:hypothetical protein
MSDKMRDVMVEGFIDIFLLIVDLITAPILAVCRVVSDFVHRRGHYSRVHYGNPDRM